MDTSSQNTILDHLDDVELDLLMSDSEYASSFLKEEGFNVEEEYSYAPKQIKKLKFMTTALTNKKTDSEKMKIAYERIKQAILNSAQKTTESLQQLLQQKRPAMQYRKLESWSDEEIKDVLNDIDLMDVLEELDKLNKNV